MCCPVHPGWVTMGRTHTEDIELLQHLAGAMMITAQTLTDNCHVPDGVILRNY